MRYNAATETWKRTQCEKQYAATEACGAAAHVATQREENRRRRLQKEHRAVEENANENTGATRIRTLLKYGNGKWGILGKPAKRPQEQEQTPPTPRRRKTPRIKDELNRTKETEQQKHRPEAVRNRRNHSGTGPGKLQEKQPMQELIPTQGCRQKQNEEREEENARDESKQKPQLRTQKEQQEHGKSNQHEAAVNKNTRKKETKVTTQAQKQPTREQKNEQQQKAMRKKQQKKTNPQTTCPSRDEADENGKQGRHADKRPKDEENSGQTTEKDKRTEAKRFIDWFCRAPAEERPGQEEKDKTRTAKKSRNENETTERSRGIQPEEGQQYKIAREQNRKRENATQDQADKPRCICEKEMPPKRLTTETTATRVPRGSKRTTHHPNRKETKKSTKQAHAEHMKSGQETRKKNHTSA